MQSSDIYLFYLKINKKLIGEVYNKNTKIQTRITLQFSFKKNLFKCLHLLISSDFLFHGVLSIMWLIIQSFSITPTFEIQIFLCRQKNADAKLTFAELRRKIFICVGIFFPFSFF